MHLPTHNIKSVLVCTSTIPFKEYPHGSKILESIIDPGMRSKMPISFVSFSEEEYASLEKSDITWGSKSVIRICVHVYSNMFVSNCTYSLAKPIQIVRLVLPCWRCMYTRHSSFIPGSVSYQYLSAWQTLSHSHLSLSLSLSK